MSANVDSGHRTGLVRSAVDRWKSQLIDLGGRNNLLYYKDRATGTLDLSAVAGADEGTVGRLLAGSKVRLSDIYGMDPDRLPQMARRARATFKKAQENLEERGLFTLHCGWGLATWQGERSTSEPSAPVLVCHAALSPRGGAAEDFDLELDGEWELSPTLLHALAADFGVTIDPASFDDALEAAVAGDALGLFERFTKAAAEIPGFAISPRAVLANFSYANLAMVVDLDHGIEVMTASDLICAIVGDEDARQRLRERQASTDVPGPDYIPPADEFLVVDADASQSYVINAAVGGANLVVEGPPGTGKSQTIANLIATLSARGKRTLFVAEKRAAIEAVLKRLEAVGLADLVLDLHDSTFTRAKVIADLDRSLRSAASTPLIDFGPQQADLARHRAELVARSKAMTEVHQPWGLRAVDIISELPGFEETVRSSTRLSPGALAKIDQTVRLELESDLERLVLLGGLAIVQGSSLWSEALKAETIISADAARALGTALRRLRFETMPAVGQRLEAMVRSCGLRQPATIGEWSGAFALLDQVSQTLSRFEPTVFDQNLDQVLADLAPATANPASRAFATFNSTYRTRKKQMVSLWRGPAPSAKELYEALAVARDLATTWRTYSLDGGHPRLPADLEQSRSDFEGFIAEMRAVEAAAVLPGLLAQTPIRVAEQLDRLLAEDVTLERLPEVHRLWRKLSDAGVGATVIEIAQRGFDAERACRCLRYVWLSSVFDELKSQSAEIAQFNGDVHRATVQRFGEADTSHIGSAPQRIRRLVAERVTQARSDHPNEAELLAHQARLKRKHKTIRQLRAEAPHVLAALKPCWAMSPLLVAQLLPNEPSFDVVVFDEASQVTPSGAIGALARAPQAVVAGDRKQLPPTSFFISSAGEDEDEDTETEESGTDFTENIESILDVMGALLPPPNGTRTLGWHYRSLDERLIAFSNAQASLYDHALTTFPGTSIDGAITHVLVPHVDGHQDSTASSTAEVARVAELVAEHARTRPGESLGVIAFGINHANRIDEALRLARKTDDALDAYMASRPSGEAIFIKNLERVQGDERDAIVISVGYCKAANGRMNYNFGPINRDGGYRRLNVAVTRARRRMTVVSSFASLDLDDAKLTSEGPQMLKRFLEYAESGGTSLGVHSRPHVDLNPFERDVTAQLTAAGIPLVPQYGASGYWIDFAAKHPSRPGQMVLAIEADGAMYHSQPSARNRDRLRQEHLERLGWHFHRIWSQEWFLHREQEVAKAVAAYKAAVEAVDHPQSLGPGAVAQAVLESKFTTVDRRADAEPTTAAPAVGATPERSGPFPVRRCPTISDYSVGELVAIVRWIESDTLLRTDDELFEEVFKALGFKRRGRLITEALNKAIRTAHAGRTPAHGRTHALPAVPGSPRTGPALPTWPSPPTGAAPSSGSTRTGSHRGRSQHGPTQGCVEYDLRRWSDFEIQGALQRAKRWGIPYEWRGPTRLLVVPQKYEEAANRFVFPEG
jgi:very-short-patch-repair endonuclease/Mrp family chromosome partitioning ATPase